MAVVLIAITELFFLPGKPLDAAQWKADVAGNDGARHEMAPRMVAWNSLVGLPRAEVVEMLGDPSRTGASQGDDLKYRVGNERSLFALDSEWLLVRFGTDDRVREARLVTD